MAISKASSVVANQQHEVKCYPKPVFVCRILDQVFILFLGGILGAKWKVPSKSGRYQAYYTVLGSKKTRLRSLEIGGRDSPALMVD